MDLIFIRRSLTGCVNSTRGLFASGWTGTSTSNTIDYVTRSNETIMKTLIVSGVEL